MSRTEEIIKPVIQRLLDERSEVLRPAAEGGAREFPLRIPGRRRPFRADFACRLPNDGWLFIEDDDAPRALSNLTKYWKWAEECAADELVDLVHLVGPGATDLAEYVATHAQRSNPMFRYYLLRVERWESESWHADLERILDQIAVTGGDGESRRKPLREEPFIGMWKDREDMTDSVAWVRELRRTEWGPKK